MTNATPAPAGPAQLDPASRDAVLQAEVARAVRDGYTVQSVGAGQAVLTKAKRMGLLLNVLLLIVTGGLWVIYIIYRALNRKRRTLIITVDAYGRVSRS